MKKKGSKKNQPSFDKTTAPHIVSLNQHSNKNISINISYNLDPNSVISPQRLNTQNVNPNNINNNNSFGPKNPVQVYYTGSKKQHVKKNNQEVDCTFENDDKPQFLYTHQDLPPCSPQSFVEPCQISIKLLGKNSQARSNDRHNSTFQNLKPAKRRLHTEQAGPQTCTNKRNQGKNFFSTHQESQHNTIDHASHNADFERLTAMYRKFKKKDKSRSQSKSKFATNQSIQKKKPTVSNNNQNSKQLRKAGPNNSKQLHSTSSNCLKAPKQLRHKHSDSQLPRKSLIRKPSAHLNKSKSIDKVLRKETIHNQQSKKQLIKKQNTKKNLSKKTTIQDRELIGQRPATLIQKLLCKNSSRLSLTKDLMRLLDKNNSSSVLSQQVQSSLRDETSNSVVPTSRNLEELCDTYTLVNKYSLEMTNSIREMLQLQKKSKATQKLDKSTQDVFNYSANVIKQAWKLYKQAEVVKMYANLFSQTLQPENEDFDDVFESQEIYDPETEEMNNQLPFDVEQEQIMEFHESENQERDQLQNEQEQFWDEQDYPEHQEIEQRHKTQTEGSDYEFDHHKYKFMVQECIKNEESQPVSRQQSSADVPQQLQRPSWNRISQLLHEQILHNKIDPSALLPEMIKQSELNKQWIEDVDAEPVHNIPSNRTDYYTNLIEERGIADRIKNNLAPQLPISSNTYDLKHSSRRVSLSSSTSSLQVPRQLYQSTSSKSLDQHSSANSSTTRMKKAALLGRSSNNSSNSKKPNNTSRIEEMINNQMLIDDDSELSYTPMCQEPQALTVTHNTAFQSQQEQADLMVLQFKKKSIDSFLDVGLHECGVQNKSDESHPSQPESSSVSHDFNQQIKIRSGGVPLLQSASPQMPQLPIVSWYPLSLDSMDEGRIDQGLQQPECCNPDDNMPVSSYFKPTPHVLPKNALNTKTQIVESILEQLVEEYAKQFIKKARFMRNLVDAVTFTRPQQMVPKKSKASPNSAFTISATPADIKIYLSSLMRFVFGTAGQKANIVKHINTHLGIASAKMLYYLRQDYSQQPESNEFDDSGLDPDGCPYDESVMVISLNSFQLFQANYQTLNPTAINPYVQCWHRALFQCLNQCLDQHRPYGLHGKPYDWQTSSYVKHTPIHEKNIISVFETAIRKVILNSQYLSGTIFDKPENFAIYYNRDVTDEHREQIQEDRMSRMLADQLLEEEVMWIDYEDQKLELSMELSEAIYQRVLFELTTQLKKLARRRAIFN